MIIILEGTEATGKSTLAKLLSSQTGYPIIHMDKPKTEEDRVRMFTDYLDRVALLNDVIFDRCWYSEMVYGAVMRDGSCISLKQMYDLEAALLHKSAIIIHCTDATSLLWDRCKVRGEDHVLDIDTLDELKCGFDNLMHKVSHLVPVFKYELSNSKM